MNRDDAQRLSEKFGIPLDAIPVERINALDDQARKWVDDVLPMIGLAAINPEVASVLTALHIRNLGPDVPDVVRFVLAHLLNMLGTAATYVAAANKGEKPKACLRCGSTEGLHVCEGKPRD